MRLGDMLLQAKVINELQLNAAIAEQQRWGGKLGQILVRMGALTEELLVLALCRQLNLPRADLDAVHAVPDALKERIDRMTCERYHILPLAYVAERRAMQLAMSDPFDVAAVDDLTRILGTRIEPFLVGDNALGNAIRRLYSAASTTASFSEGGEAMSLIDNAGNVRANRPAPPRANTGSTTMPPASSAINPAVINPTPPAHSIPPAMASAPTSVPATDLAARIDEQARAVRAVAALLVERGVIRPEDLPR